MSDRRPSETDWSAAARAGVDATAGPAGKGSGPLVARIRAVLVEALVDAARAGLPNEACGLLVATESAAAGGVPTRFVRLANAAASPYRYLIDPDEQLQVMLELDDAGEVPWGICHSHVATPAVPSATDVGLAFYPDSLYLICSLAGDVPEVRAWSIRHGAVHEVPLAVT